MRTNNLWRKTLLASLAVGLTSSVFVVPAAANTTADVSLVINEVIQNNDQIDDAIELLNTGTAPIDLSGWTLADDKNSLTIDDGTMIAPGQFLAITTDDDARADKFGLGKADEANVLTPDGVLVDHFAWEGHQPTSYGRCPDGTGAFGVTVEATPNAANACTASAVGNIVINEIESQDTAGGPDWVEFFNNGLQPIDLGGLSLSDEDANTFSIPAGTVIEPASYTVVTQDEFDFGLGGADQLALSDGDVVVDSYSWASHAEHTYGRFPDGVGEFDSTIAATPGAENQFAEVETPAIVVNEVETSDGEPGDWIELYNLESTDFDLSGWVVRDNDDAHVSVLPEGSVIPAGGFFVVEESQLGYGLGKTDSARIYLPGGHILVDEYSWTAVLDDSHSPTTFGRCADGTGDWQITTTPTKGAANDCGLAIRINEIASQGDPVGDWVELANVGYETADLSGLQLVDSSDHGAVTLPQGTELAAGQYLRVYVYETFGLGAADQVSLLDAQNTELDTVSWDEHITPTLGRCPDGTGDFAVTREATPGATNACEGDLITAAWPGADTMEAPVQPNFGEDMSGVVYATDGTIWAVNNGNGTLHQLQLTDGELVELQQWTLRYSDGFGTVDAEGVALIDGDASKGVLVASERNTGMGDRGSRPSVLRYDVSDSDELLATDEWNLSEFYPGIGANAGLEGVAWIADADLVASGLIDERTGDIYDPSTLPAHGNGVVFVGVEATNTVAGYVLGDAGEMIRITEFDTVFHGVMELEYDASNGQLWALCDDACEGRTEVFEIGADTDAPGTFASIAIFERPAGSSNYANEGLAFAPADQCIDGTREVIWANDSNDDGAAFRIGSISCTAVSGLEDDGSDNENTDGESDPVDPADDETTPSNVDETSGGDEAIGGSADETSGEVANGNLAQTGAAVIVLIALGLVLVMLGAILTARRRA